MEAVILIGVQGAGKTTFYQQNFFHTHVRISLDMLKTHEREALLMGACLAARQPFVLDNTNLTVEGRSFYISRAKLVGFSVTAYWFRIDRRAAIARNSKRTDKKPVPIPALLKSYKNLEEPTAEEGFNTVFTVTLNAEREFVIEHLVS
jgi:predicted kinase